MDATTADLDQLELALADGKGAPLVVHHFATWCDPCEKELPILERLLQEGRGAGARSVAIAWDLFMAPVKPEEAVRVCGEFLNRVGASFDRLLIYTGTPEELFARLSLADGTVPYTDVRDRDGAIVATFPQPLFAADEQRRFTDALRDATDGGAS